MTKWIDYHKRKPEEGQKALFVWEDNDTAKRIIFEIFNSENFSKVPLSWQPIYWQPFEVEDDKVD